MFCALIDLTAKPSLNLAIPMTLLLSGPAFHVIETLLSAKLGNFHKITYISSIELKIACK